MIWRRQPTSERPDFERMYLAHRDRLFAYLVYHAGDRALAEDLLGDVFERAYKARDRYDPERGTPVAWLFTIAANRVRDHHRRAKFERTALERIASVQPVVADGIFDSIPERDRVMRALTVLSPRAREIIALRFGADLTVPEIARVTQQPLTTVEGQLFRALRRLAKVLDADAEESLGSASEPAEAPRERTRRRSFTGALGAAHSPPRGSAQR